METIRDLRKDVIENIKDLVRINIDSAEGFNAAAETIDHAEITRLFHELSEQRRDFAGHLQDILEMNDAEARDAGSIKGAFHRWWLELRGGARGGDAYAVLAEAERGEDAIKARYEEALKETPGNPVNDVLLNQYAKVRKSHDAIRAMRDAAAGD